MISSLDGLLAGNNSEAIMPQAAGESGDHDGIFPVGAVKESVARAREVYAVFGASDRVQTDYFEGRHQISGRRAYDFLAEQLMR